MQLELDFNKGKHVVVSLSGGMDSSTLLLKALNEYDTVTALSFDYGQKHRVELERAQSLVNYLNEKGHKITYQQIKLEQIITNLVVNASKYADKGLVKLGFKIENHSYPLGQIVASKNELKVAAKNGFLSIYEIQMPGKRKMDIKSLLNGYVFDENSKML